jgi:ribosomal protein S11
MIDNYYTFKAKLKKYPFSAHTMCEEFLEEFIKVKNNKLHIEVKINKVIMYIYLFKNKVQKWFTGLTMKQYIKNLIKKVIQ